MNSLDDSLKTMARRLRGIPRQSVEIALPRQQIADCFVVPNLLHAESVVYSAGGTGRTRFDYSLMERFGCRVQVLREPYASVLEQAERAMQSFGHRHIDLMRLDVQGNEYAALAALERSELRPCQLVIEFNHHLPELGVEDTEDALERLNMLGYRIFSCDDLGRSFSLAYL